VRVLGERVRSCSEHSEERTVAVAVHGGGCEKRAEDEERRRRTAADQPAERSECGRQDDEEEPRLRQVEYGRRTRRSPLLFTDIALGETARRPVRLRRVAAARAME
jgi:hypothetical protein